MSIFEDILCERKVKEEEKAKASSVIDSGSEIMRLKPKSGEYIEIDYSKLQDFLKTSLNRTFTKNSAKKFAEDLRKFLGLYTESEAEVKSEKDKSKK